LKDWLELIQNMQAADAASILSQAELLSPLLRQYLEETGFPAVWQKLQQNLGRAPILSAFHAWFDGLRTRQLLTGLGVETAQQPKESLVAELLTFGGYPGVQEFSEQLKLLEQLQGVPAQEPKEKAG
jgi:hypothetical protein